MGKKTLTTNQVSNHKTATEMETQIENQQKYSTRSWTALLCRSLVLHSAFETNVHVLVVRLKVTLLFISQQHYVK